MCILQSEFTELASNLSDYVVKLLDKVQGNEELNVILNNSDGLEHTPNKTLARLQLAIDYKEKKVSGSRGWIQGVSSTYIHFMIHESARDTSPGVQIRPF